MYAGRGGDGGIWVIRIAIVLHMQLFRYGASKAGSIQSVRRKGGVAFNERVPFLSWGPGIHRASPTSPFCKKGIECLASPINETRCCSTYREEQCGTMSWNRWVIPKTTLLLTHASFVVRSLDPDRLCLTDTAVRRA